MVAAFIAACALSFLPDEPLAEQVALGRRIAGQPDQDQWERILKVEPQSAQLVPIDHLYLGDRVPIGMWSDGIRKLEVEWVIRLSPELMSRWLGYLQARELWPDREVAEQWEVLRALYGERELFVVILSAFPRQNLLDPSASERPRTDELENIEIKLYSGGQVIPAQAQEFYRQRARTRSELDRVPWWSLIPLRPVLELRFEHPFEPPLIPRGDYSRSWWLVSPSCALGSQFELKIASRRKIRVAEFGKHLSRK